MVYSKRNECKMLYAKSSKDCFAQYIWTFWIPAGDDRYMNINCVSKTLHKLSKILLLCFDSQELHRFPFATILSGAK